MPVLLIEGDEGYDGADIRMLKRPADPALAAAVDTILPGGKAYLERPHVNFDNSYFWLRAFEDRLNAAHPLPDGEIGIILAQESPDEGSFDPPGIDVAPNLAQLDDALIIDLALKHLRPGCASHRGANDWHAGDKLAHLVLDGASNPLLVEIADQRDAQVFEFKTPVYYGTEESPEHDLDRLLKEHFTPGWSAICQFTVDHLVLELPEKGQDIFRALQRRDSDLARAWFEKALWHTFGQLEDPVIGHHQLEKFGYVARNILSDEELGYTVTCGTLDEYHEHVLALLAQASCTSDGGIPSTAVVRCGAVHTKTRPAIQEWGLLSKPQRQALKIIVDHFRPRGEAPINFVSNRYSRLRRAPLAKAFVEPDLSAHQIILAHQLLKDFLMKKGKSDAEAEALLV